MCGILGYISSEKKNLQKGLDIMAHRGPDAAGVYSAKNENFISEMGHRRLSILDLKDDSNQPFISENKQHVLIFNGEIYNFQELKEKLERKNIIFKTKGDTEVLLQWLVTYGPNGIKDLEGMFAFSWYNKETGLTILCRDSLGIKPLYVYQKDSLLIYSSEIKPIFCLAPDGKKIDESLISEFLLNGFLYEPDTGFKNIRKLAAGSYEVYNSEGNLISSQQYWDVSHVKPGSSDPKDCEYLIKKSIANHTLADVPLGLFFSGGMDSSIILSEFKKNIRPLTIKSNADQYRNAGMSNDYSYATKIAKLWNVDLEEVELSLDNMTNEDFINAINRVSIGNEELMADFTFHSSLLLSHAAAEKKYKVMLSGMGADEIFGGYPRYKLLKYSVIYKYLQPFLFLLKKNKSFSKKIDRFASFYNEKDFAFKYASLVGVFNRQEVELLTNKMTIHAGLDKFQNKINLKLKKVENRSDLKKGMYLDFSGFLAHNFSVADKSSMLASLELRVPLATKKMVEFAWGLKDTHLINLKHTKILLRNFLLKKLPSSIVNRKKAGFNAPLDGFIKRLGKESLILLLENNGLFDFLNKTFIVELITEHYCEKKNNTYKIYQLIYFSFWLKNFATETDSDFILAKNSCSKTIKHKF